MKKRDLKEGISGKIEVICEGVVFFFQLFFFFSLFGLGVDKDNFLLAVEPKSSLRCCWSGSCVSMLIGQSMWPAAVTMQLKTAELHNLITLPTRSTTGM